MSSSHEQLPSSLHLSLKTGVQLIISGIIVYTNDTIPVLEFTVDNSSTTVFTPQAVKNGSITSFYRSPRLSDDKHEVRLNIAKFTPSAGALNSGGHKLGGEMLDVATNSTTEGEGTGHTVAPIGPIIGGTIGGLVLLAASVLVIYLWNANRRKNRRPYIYYAAPLDEIGKSIEIGSSSSYADDDTRFREGFDCPFVGREGNLS